MMYRRNLARILALVMLALAALGAAACQSPESDIDDAASQSSPGGDDEAEGDDDGAGGDEAGDAEAGKKHFATCAGCHGPDGKGLPNLGKDLTASVFVTGKTDAELVEFLKVGRAADAPDNTTHVAMPPKGGNPALSDDDLLDVVAYVRTIQQ